MSLRSLENEGPSQLGPSSQQPLLAPLMKLAPAERPEEGDLLLGGLIPQIAVDVSTPQPSPWPGRVPANPHEPKRNCA